MRPRCVIHSVLLCYNSYNIVVMLKPRSFILRVSVSTEARGRCVDNRLRTCCSLRKSPVRHTLYESFETVAASNMLRRVIYQLLNVFGSSHLVFLFNCWCWRLHGAAAIIAFTNWIHDTMWKLQILWQNVHALVRCTRTWGSIHFVLTGSS